MVARKDLDLLRRPADPEDCGPLTDESLCRCRSAVKRAFSGMIASGVSPSTALDAAVRVYRYHHPAASEVLAYHTVEAWVTRPQLH